MSKPDLRLLKADLENRLVVNSMEGPTSKRKSICVGWTELLIGFALGMLLRDLIL